MFTNPANGFRSFLALLKTPGRVSKICSPCQSDLVDFVEVWVCFKCPWDSNYMSRSWWSCFCAIVIFAHGARLHVTWMLNVSRLLRFRTSKKDSGKEPELSRVRPRSGVIVVTKISFSPSSPFTVSLQDSGVARSLSMNFSKVSIAFPPAAVVVFF